MFNDFLTFPTVIAMGFGQVQLPQSVSRQMLPKRSRNVPLKISTQFEAVALVRNPLQSLSETSGSHWTLDQNNYESDIDENDQESDIDECQKEAISPYQNDVEMYRVVLSVRCTTPWIHNWAPADKVIRKVP